MGSGAWANQAMANLKTVQKRWGMVLPLAFFVFHTFYGQGFAIWSFSQLVKIFLNRLRDKELLYHQLIH